MHRPPFRIVLACALFAGCAFLLVPLRAAVLTINVNSTADSNSATFTATSLGSLSANAVVDGATQTVAIQIGAAIATTTTTGANQTAGYSDNDQNVLLTATITSTSPVDQGTVTFTVKNSGNTTVGSAVTSGTVSNGAASATYVLPGGTLPQTLTIQAAYSGSANFAASSDNTRTLTVTKAATTTFVGPASAPPSASAQNVTLLAIVAGSIVNEGTVTFTVRNAENTVIGETATGAVTTSIATATYSLPGGMGGQTLSITGDYSGGTKFLASTGTATLSTTCPTITLMPRPLGVATAGSAYSQAIGASGGTAPYTFAAVGPLPDGLSLSGAGVLSGTPPAADAFTFAVRATDAASCTGTEPYVLAVRPPIGLVVETLKGGIPYLSDSQIYWLVGQVVEGILLKAEAAGLINPHVPQPVTRVAGGDGDDLVPFAVDVTLQPGPNTVTVTATNDLGHTATQAFTVTVSQLSYALTEGVSSSAFRTFLLIANPNTTAAVATVATRKEDGTTAATSIDVPAQARVTVPADSLPGEGSGAYLTTVATSPELPLLVERATFFDGTMRAGTASGAPDAGTSRTWYFAEGSQRGTFSTFLLLGNSGAEAANVTVTYLTDTGAAVTRGHVVGASSRLTIATSTIPELANTSFGMVISADVPISAERAQYFGASFTGGHTGEGTPVTSTRWYHAEGATGQFFDTYFLWLNPNATAANVTATYRTEGGVTVTRTYTIPASSRLTVRLQDQDAALANQAVWTTVTSDLPIVSERSVYWPSGTTWMDGHNGMGVPAAQTRWGFAEGAAGGPLGFQNYYLFANPGNTDAQVTITFLLEGGAPVTHTLTVSAMSRVTLPVSAAVPGLAGRSFGATITSTNDVPIVVERSMYWMAQGQAIGGGASAPALRRP